MSHMQKLWTMASRFPGRDVRFRWHLGPPALSLQSCSHWVQPFITGLSQRPFKLKKGERNIERARWSEREETRSASGAPSARLCSCLWKKCCWWRAQMLKESIIANNCGRKTRGGSALVQPCYCMCSLRPSQGAFLGLSYSLTSVCIINIISEAWCCCGEQHHSAPIQRTVQ